VAPDGGLTGPWFRRPRPVASPRARLVCFPHAGGTASFFRSWARLLPAGVELLAVQYPGREDRIAEPLIGELSPLAGQLAAALAPATAQPLVLLGHSLGAKVAYEVAVRLAAQAGPRLSGLVVSGHPGPGRERPGAWHLASDDALCAELRRTGGTAEETLSHPELLGLVLPIVRNDYQIAETCRIVPGTALSCPVLAFLGDRDSDVTPEEADAWAAVTTGPFSRRVYPGGHFYLTGCRESLLAEVISAVWPLPAGPAAAPPGAAAPAGH
jgi:pyochelin biosynthesis protein PchC